ncbi:jg27851, partial [Pararge aegeria aegeria]
PKWYPIFGCSTLVQKYTKLYGSQWKALSQMAKEYSTQVLGIKLGLEPIVVVFGENNIRRVFMEREFEGRPNSFFIRLRCLGKRMGIFQHVGTKVEVKNIIIQVGPVGGTFDEYITQELHASEMFQMRPGLRRSPQQT